NTLEKNEVSLDESLKLFEEGTRLTAFCSDKLKQAQQKITVLTKEKL
ncbi:MAG: exodeoxyribonuclease VII small subunit, partial [Eubacterium sp.]